MKNPRQHQMRGSTSMREFFATHRGFLHARGTGARSPFLVALLGLAALALLIAPSAASADTTRNLVASFGSLSEPHGIAVDQATGDLYVADTGNHRVEKFDEEGHLLLGFGADVGGAGVDTCTTTCAVGTSGTAPGAFEAPTFVAVDNDASSTSFGDVYVADTGDDLVSKFDDEGHLITTWGNGGLGETADGQLTGKPGVAFSPIDGIAVDPAGTLDVFNDDKSSGPSNNQVFRFAPAGGFGGEVDLGQFGTLPRGLAVDGAGDFYKVDESGGLIEEITPAGVELRSITGTAATAFTLIPSGDLYLADEAGRIDHYAFDGTGEVEEPGGTACFSFCAPTDSASVGFAATGIDVAPTSGDVYLSNPGTGQVDVYEQVTIPHAKTLSATEVHATTATLDGEVSAEGGAVTECLFEWGETESYGHIAQCEALPGAGTNPVEAKIIGLQAGTTYHFRLVVADANDEGHAPNPGADETLNTPPAPSIEEAKSEGETAHGAKLTALIDPNGFATTYRFEYGTDTDYGHVAGEGSLVASTQEEPVSVQIEGLEPDTTYHWRVVAESVNGKTESVDHTFIFLTAAEIEAGCPNEALRTGLSAHLPDCRAYEMVTPPQKNGALIGDVTFVGGVPDLASNGERVIASAIQCFAGAESCNAQHGDGVGSPYAFTRAGSGWQTTALAPSAARFPANTPYGYSADTGAALFSMSTPPRGEDDFYLREPDGDFVDIGPNTPPGGGGIGPKGGRIEAAAQAQTSDFSHLAWSTSVKWPFDERAEGTKQVYEYAGDHNAQPFLVGVTGPQGSNSLVSACGIHLGAQANIALAGEMSANGRTVFFSALPEPNGPCPTGTGAEENAGQEVPVPALYARVDGELPDAHTVAISRFRGPGESCDSGQAPAERSCRERTSPSECGSGLAADEASCRAAATDPAGAGFIGASSDGTKALFLSTQQLTDEASEDPSEADKSAEEGGCTVTNGPNGCNLYLYDTGRPEGQNLIDVSHGDNAGTGPRVQGVLAVSPDASHVYFVAKGVLAQNDDALGHEARPDAENLYLSVIDGAHPQGRTTFIAPMSGSDIGEWNQNPGKPANVTPNGNSLVFLSHADLTPDDTSRSGANQVFRYDAETGELNRISIGQRGFDNDGNRSTIGSCGANGQCSEDALIVVSDASARTDPTMSDEGTKVFFQSPVGLTPAALDDKLVGSDAEGDPTYAQNIYEWEADGTGVCGQATGCVSLISASSDLSLNNGGDPLCGGVGIPSSVCLLGTDAEGENVFFATAQSLVGSDTDSEVDFYDARERGGFAEPPAPEPCASSEGCHGPGTQAGAEPSPATPGFNGPPEGPVNPQKPKCKKSQVKKHGRCVARKPAKHHKKSHNKRHGKRTGHNGGGHK